MDELLTSISPELVDAFAAEFFAKRGRKILHDSRRWRVLDTWIGDPAEHFRYNIYPRAHYITAAYQISVPLQVIPETSTAEYSLFRFEHGWCVQFMVMRGTCCPVNFI